MALISIVILPLLPNKNYTLLDIPFVQDLFTSGTKVYDFLIQLNVFNPFKIWLFVVFITGISYIGYFLVKTVGKKKGLGLTGFLGGLASSTAVTISMSKKSKGKKSINGYALAIILAAGVMLLRILFEVLVVNRALLGGLIIPLGVMSMIAFGFATYIYFRREDKGTRKEIPVKNPFELNTAIKFGLFFLLVLVVSRTLLILLGDTGIYIASVFAGLADVDAITLTLSSMALSGVISNKVAILSITLAAATNTLVKAGFVRLFGEKKLANFILILVLIILAAGILTAIFI